MDDFKKEILEMSSCKLMKMHGSMMELIYGDRALAELDAEGYERYWNIDRPRYMEQLKAIENELSYRSIVI